MNTKFIFSLKVSLIIALNMIYLHSSYLRFLRDHPNFEKYMQVNLYATYRVML